MIWKIESSNTATHRTGMKQVLFPRSKQPEIGRNVNSLKVIKEDLEELDGVMVIGTRSPIRQQSEKILANQSFHWIAGVSAALQCFGLTNFIITNKFTGTPCNQ